MQCYKHHQQEIQVLTTKNKVEITLKLMKMIVRKKKEFKIHFLDHKIMMMEMELELIMDMAEMDLEIMEIQMEAIMLIKMGEMMTK